jgi:hypothetical protein
VPGYAEGLCKLCAKIRTTSHRHSTALFASMPAMVKRPVLVDVPLDVYVALEARAAARGVRPARVMLDIVSAHVLPPPRARGARSRVHLRVLGDTLPIEAAGEWQPSPTL